jgi:hypothetical protein
MRMNMYEEVATPRSVQPTLAWIETTKAVLQNPIPIPITKEPVAAQASALPGSSVTSNKLPATTDRPPMTATRRYDVRTINRPAAKLAKAQLIELAPSTSPPDRTLPPITP